MSHTPVFQFLVGQPPTALDPSGAQWRAPLPLHRKGGGHGGLTYGDYFTAAMDFLGRDRPPLLRTIIGFDPSRPVSAAAIHRIHIHLAKHGAFYHPARVTLFDDVGHPTHIVLNVAVSEAGRLRLAAEAEHLQTLYRLYPDSSVPRVYGRGTGRCASGEDLPMFAGQWLDGFHELHLSKEASSQTLQWTVWDSDHGTWRLDQKQTASFFRQAVFILTRYFDPHTLGAIMEWHHAAGDFIVRKVPEGIDVRLITVRRYNPLFDMPESEKRIETLLEALAVFWVKTSLWMRLDRLDGVGELVWADGDIVAPMWEGFVHGLVQTAALNDLPAEWVRAVQAYLAGCAPADFTELGTAIIGTFPDDVPEKLLIKTHLEQHSEQMAAAMATVFGNPADPNQQQ